MNSSKSNIGESEEQKNVNAEEVRKSINLPKINTRSREYDNPQTKPPQASSINLNMEARD